MCLYPLHSDKFLYIHLYYLNNVNVKAVAALQCAEVIFFDTKSQVVKHVTSVMMVITFKEVTYLKAEEVPLTR
jgi:hypothetical protein